MAHASVTRPYCHDGDGHEFEQIPGDSEGQESLVCSSPWVRKESDMTVTELQQKTF